MKKLAAFVEKMPTQVTEEIERFCEQIAPGQTPFYVPVKPEAGAAASECHTNVKHHVLAHGGAPIYGWTIWQSPVLLDAEFHCNWMNPAGDLLDITPKVDGETRILFLPDHSVQWNGRPVPSRLKALQSDPQLVRWVMLTEQMHRIRSKYLVRQPFSQVDGSRFTSLLYESARLALAINKSWTVNPDQQAKAASNRKAKRKAERQRRKQQRRRK